MSTARRLFLLFFLSLPLAAAAAPVTVENLRMWQDPEKLRLVFDISRPLEYRVFPLSSPNRIVIDMDEASTRGRLPAIDADNAYVARLRMGRKGRGLRYVLDLKKAARPRSFVLKPFGQYGHRLVIDLYDAEAQPAKPVVRAPATPKKKRQWVVAIDAGHGGEDPGAIGRRYRTLEKKVVLSIARELKKLVAAEPGMRPLMVRTGDYYVSLGDRYQKARGLNRFGRRVRQPADVFVSIHADAVPGRRARGSSVYALSARGASSNVARFLASRENAADQVGGVSLEDKDPLLKKVLVDLAHTGNMPLSLQLGKDVLSELKKVGHVHLNRVEQAGFAVLKAPDIPSILVETAFISNPTEEKKLRSRRFQRNMARAIFRGIKKYLSRQREQPQYVVAGTSATKQKPKSPRRHRVRQGETLGSIARRYQVHVDALRFANNINGNKIIAGSVLLIP